MGGAFYVNAVIVSRISPDPGFTCCMDHCVAALRSAVQFLKVVNAALYRDNAGCFQMLSRAALKSDDLMVEGSELSAYRASEEAAATGDEYSQWLTLHLLCSPFRQFFTANLGVVPDIHRESGVEQDCSNTPGNAMCLCQLQQVKVDPFVIHWRQFSL
jgi:hypothetical protein